MMRGERKLVFISIARSTRLIWWLACIIFVSSGLSECCAVSEIPVQLVMGGAPLKLRIGEPFEFSITDQSIVRATKQDTSLLLEPLRVGRTIVYVDVAERRRAFVIEVIPAEGTTRTQVGEVQEQTPTPLPRGKPIVTTISPLAAQVQRAIGLPSVQVHLEDGRIVLEGTVANSAERERAERIARQFSPQGVINRLIIAALPAVGVTAPTERVTTINALITPVVSTAPGELRRIEVEVPVGVSMLIEASKGTIEQVAIGNPELLGVLTPSKLQLLIVGKKEGQTNVIVWEKIKGVKERPEEVMLWTNFWFRVVPMPEREVEPKKPKPTLEEVRKRIEDAIGIPTVKVALYTHDEGYVAILRGEVETEEEAALAEQIAQLWAARVIRHLKVKHLAPPPPAPEEEKARKIQQLINLPEVQVTIVENQIILSGKVKRDEDKTRAEEIAKAFGTVVNQIEVEKPKKIQQILVEVRVLEVSRTALDKIGIQVGEQLVWGVGGAGVGAGAGVNVEMGQITVGEIPQAPETGVGAVYTPGPFTRLSPLAMRLNMLIEKGLARLLARPQQFVLEGTDATFLVGGMVPLPITTLVGGAGAGAGALGGVQFAPFGITLSIHPEATDAGEIFVQYRVESSAPDYSIATTILGARVPGFRVRRHEDRVLLRDGDTLVISGLIQEEDRQNWRRLPILSSIPIIGELFKSREFSRSQSELVIMMTVHLFEETVSEEALELYQRVLELPALPAPAGPAVGGIGGFGAGIGFGGVGGAGMGW